MADGGTLELGDVQLRFLETPGHTPESVCVLVFDLEQDAERPHAVLTGDTLFIGDVGRPDLMASVGFSSEELAGWLYDSLHEKILPLPDETLVYPGHGAGSMCGKNLSSDTFSTLALQRQTNYALQPMERDAFIKLVTANQAEQPAYFSYDADLNRRERATLDTVLEQKLRPLTLEEVARERNAGAQVLDSRSADDFAAGHVAGSINIGLGGQYATWAGTLLDQGRSIILVCKPGTERESALRLGRIGFDQISGYLDGGFATVTLDRPDLVERHTRHTVESLRQLLSQPEPPLVLDVRTPGEWEGGHIDGAQHVPLNRLPRELDDVPRDRELVVTCKAGYRSSAAASLLQAAGYERVSDLIGGMDAWNGATAACNA